MVRMFFPSAFFVVSTQALTDFPSTTMVHVPHAPSRHPSLTESKRKSSRRNFKSDLSSDVSRKTPFTVKQYFFSIRSTPSPLLDYIVAKIPSTSVMTPWGHLTAHIPHEIQRSGCRTARFPSIVMAFVGQFLTQSPQAIQLTSHSFRASAADLGLAQRGISVFSSGRRRIKFLGQALTQAPHPVQTARLTRATFFLLRATAWTGQTLAHDKPPTQP